MKKVAPPISSTDDSSAYNTITNERSSNGQWHGEATNVNDWYLISYTEIIKAQPRLKEGAPPIQIYIYLSDYTKMIGAQRKYKSVAPPILSTNI